jgi:hypothetical protein
MTRQDLRILLLCLGVGLFFGLAVHDIMSFFPVYPGIVK